MIKLGQMTISFLGPRIYNLVPPNIHQCTTNQFNEKSLKTVTKRRGHLIINKKNIQHQKLHGHCFEFCKNSANAINDYYYMRPQSGDICLWLADILQTKRTEYKILGGHLQTLSAYCVWCMLYSNVVFTYIHL